MMPTQLTETLNPFNTAYIYLLLKLEKSSKMAPSMTKDYGKAVLQRCLFLKWIFKTILKK
ncbi:hypothetical protein T4B_13377 [Trichinella pseudospiralis]|uniref:Uncharacterized protein n=1 Tax=Trichinella pseudospiralis TaxID=6337 RepID=A0A0V1HM08_TRIPS|nr:hypothetical protein T4B_13377 [Trichinella pseudospiralis]